MAILHNSFLAWTLLATMAVTACGARKRSRSLARAPPSVAFHPAAPHAFTAGKNAHTGISNRVGKVTLPVPAPRFGHRYAVMQAQVLERPGTKVDVGGGAPPIPPFDDRPLGGGGGGDEAFLRRIDDADAVELFDDWIARTRVLRMGSGFSEDEELEEKYTKAFEDLEELRSFSQNVASFTVKDGQKMIMGMYSNGKVLAVAAGSLVRYPTTGWRASVNDWLNIKGRFEVKYISLSPGELRSESSVADLQLRKGLRLMVEELGVELEFVKELTDDD